MYRGEGVQLVLDETPKLMEGRGCAYRYRLGPLDGTQEVEVQ